jgi:hypothetical protein
LSYEWLDTGELKERKKQQAQRIQQQQNLMPTLNPFNQHDHLRENRSSKMLTLTTQRTLKMDWSQREMKTTLMNRPI